MDISALQETFRPHFERIGAFQFTIDNPVFWVSLLVFFLFFARFWDVKKSFSFVVSLGIVLLAATKVEASVAAAMAEAGEAFDPVAIRVLAVVLIFLIVLYYVFIKTDSSF
jgi:hypothetical protein